MNNTRQLLLRRIQGIERSITNTPSRDDSERYLRELETIRRHAENLPNTNDIVDNIDLNINLVRNIIDTDNTGLRNEERVRVDPVRLRYLVENGCNPTEIGRDGLLGRVMHPNTVRNHSRKNGIKFSRQLFTTLSNDELRPIIRQINEQSPNTGILGMLSHLRSKTPPILLQRARCCVLMRLIDPQGTAARWAQAIRRRQYSVPTPNSLWHIDTNHALIR